MTTKRIRKKRAKRMPAARQAQTRRPPPPDVATRPGPLSGDEVDPVSWVTPGAAEGDRATVEEDLAERDKVND